MFFSDFFDFFTREEATTEEVEFEYPLVRRIIAYIIDMVLLCLLVFGLSLLLDWGVLPDLGIPYLGVLSDWFSLSDMNLVDAILDIYILGVLYFTAFEISECRATPGKMLLGLEMVYKPNILGITWHWYSQRSRMLVLRYLKPFFAVISFFGFRVIFYVDSDFSLYELVVVFIASLFFILSWSSYLVIFFDKKRRTLLDMLFGVCVVRSKRQ